MHEKRTTRRTLLYETHHGTSLQFNFQLSTLNFQLNFYLLCFEKVFIFFLKSLVNTLYHLSEEYWLMASTAAS